MAPDILVNRASGLPGASQATFGRLLRPTRCPRSFSERFWTILGGFWDPRTMKKTLKSVELSAKNKVFTIFAWSLQKERQKLTKPSPERPQGPQKRPRRRQERSRRAPRAPRERPRSRQEAPENRSKRTFAPKSARERPRSHLREVLEAILEPPGPHLGAFWEPPGLHF